MFLCLSIPRGSVYGFLGPDGAGKTTSIRMVLDIIRPSSGQAVIFAAHVMRHAERLCDQLVMNSGARKVFGDDLVQARGTLPRRVLIETAEPA